LRVFFRLSRPFLFFLPLRPHFLYFKPAYGYTQTINNGGKIMNDILITTDRLKIWDHVHKHLNDVYALLSDGEATAALPQFRASEVKEALDYLMGAMNQRFADERTSYRLCVQSKGDLFYLGEIMADIIDGSAGREAQMNIVLRREYRNMGYGTEAVKALTGYLFAEGGITSILAVCQLSNAAAARMLVKCGFEKENGPVGENYAAYRVVPPKQ
jgi:RimJ/RimL family protein N-acetyltransferase